MKAGEAILYVMYSILLLAGLVILAFIVLVLIALNVCMVAAFVQMAYDFCTNRPKPTETQPLLEIQ